jgi:pimeloyl-ACP methyl ester carboxylesterase
VLPGFEQERKVHGIFARSLLAAGCVAALAFASNTAVIAQTTQEVSRPQTPHAPFPYLVEEVRFPGGANGVILAGTLTRPKVSNPVGAVVLVHGSGPVDRDETYNGHKSFFVLADALTRAGYAVLRYDKRGVGQSTGDGRAATTLDLKADAYAAIRYLQGRSEIDGSRIAVVGHSEGGTIAALMSADPSPPAAAVSLAGMIAPFTEQMPLQEVLTGRDEGADATYEAVVRAYYVKVEAAATIDDDALRLAQMQALSTAWNAEFPEGSPNRNAAMDSLLAHPKFIASRWFQTMFRLDVADAIRRGTIPILFLNGSTDHQVVAAPNLDAAQRALGRETTLRRTQLLPNLNHLFQESASGSSEEYDKISQTMSPDAMRAVIQFLDLALNSARKDR